MSAAPLDTPHALGARVRATVDATRDLWGEVGVEGVLARLAPEQRAPFTCASPPRWVPERTYMAWTTAIWDGPGARDGEALRRWVDRVTDRGFGTAKRMIMSLASPWVIVRRAGALWRTEHSHGDLAVTPQGGDAGRFELRHHPFAEDDVAADAIAEAFRYIVFRCRTRWASEAHERDASGALLVTVRWG